MTQPKVVLETLLICEHVRIAENVFFIIGGATDTITVPVFPAGVPFHVATRLRISPDFTETVVTFDVRLEDQFGQSILPGAFTPSIEFEAFGPEATEPDRSFNLPLFIGGARFTRPGTYALVVRHEERELGRTYLNIVAMED